MRVKPERQPPFIEGRRTAGPDSTSGKVFGHLNFTFSFAFVIACMALYSIINSLPGSFTNLINEQTSSALGMILSFLGVPVFIAKDTVSEGGLAFRIIPECTPIFMAGLFACFIVFYQATARQKIAGLLLGIPALYLGNLARLTATFIISLHDRGLFELTHVYLGQVFSVIMVALACILWLKWVREKGPKETLMYRMAVFLVRYSIISGCIFFVWARTHHLYIKFLDLIIKQGFSIFNHQVGLANDTVVYYETFSVVILISIALAVRSVPWQKRLLPTGLGLCLLFLIHLFHRFNNVLMAYFSYTAFAATDLTLIAIGQYVAPVLMFVFLSHQHKNDISLAG